MKILIKKLLKEALDYRYNPEYVLVDKKWNQLSKLYFKLQKELEEYEIDGLFSLTRRSELDSIQDQKNVLSSKMEDMESRGEQFK